MKATSFTVLNDTHEHEEKLRRDSLELIAQDSMFADRMALIERAMAIIFGFTVDHNAASSAQKTVQLVGIRLFNAAASAVKLALSGYYQPAFHQVRDILEVGFLLDYFRRWPERIPIWEKSDRKIRRQFFDPVVVRKALDKDDRDASQNREAQYKKLSEQASHITPQVLA